MFRQSSGQEQGRKDQCCCGPLPPYGRASVRWLPGTVCWLAVSPVARSGLRGGVPGFGLGAWAETETAASVTQELLEGRRASAANDTALREQSAGWRCRPSPVPGSPAEPAAPPWLGCASAGQVSDWRHGPRPRRRHRLRRNSWRGGGPPPRTVRPHGNGLLVGGVPRRPFRAPRRSPPPRTVRPHGNGLLVGGVTRRPFRAPRRSPPPLHGWGVHRRSRLRIGGMGRDRDGGSGKSSWRGGGPPPRTVRPHGNGLLVGGVARRPFRAPRRSPRRERYGLTGTVCWLAVSPVARSGLPGGGPGLGKGRGEGGRADVDAVVAGLGQKTAPQVAPKLRDARAQHGGVGYWVGPSTSPVQHRAAPTARAPVRDGARFSLPPRPRDPAGTSGIVLVSARSVSGPATYGSPARPSTRQRACRE